MDVVWRFWLPEAALDHLASHVGDDRFDRWTRDGWIAVTAGEVLDYEQVYADIEQDHRSSGFAAGTAASGRCIRSSARSGRRLGTRWNGTWCRAAEYL